MCGIAGQSHTKDFVQEKRLGIASESLKNRGPDAEGVWVSPDKQTGLVHRRLAILDLSVSGKQPMSSPCGRYSIVFNGEIYNFRRLRAQLEAEGEVFHSESDTEILLRLWVKHGKQCLSLLRGMYAFAIWDDVKKVLFLLRDPLGIKPLYYNTNNRSISFASEIRSLCHLIDSKQVSMKALGAFLKYGNIPSPLTIYSDIKAVEPGCGLVWYQSSGNFEMFEHWSLKKVFSEGQVNPIIGRAEAVASTRSVLLSSVRDHLVSDVPVGAFLSGGIDSTAVVSLMRQVGQSQINTFSLVYDDKKLDESFYSNIAAIKYETVHQEWRVNNDIFNALATDFLLQIDQPTADGFNTWLVSKFASKSGMKVVTSGIGGDENFGGYDTTFRQLPGHWYKLNRLPTLSKKFGFFLKDVSVSLGFRSSKLSKLADLCHKETLRDAYGTFRMLFSSGEILRLFRDKEQALKMAEFEVNTILPTFEEDVSAFRRISTWEIRAYLESQLLMDSDKCSMAHGLELRTPMVDQFVTEQMAKIDEKCFFDQNKTPKSLLVDAVGDLPDEIVYRKKGTFTLPVSKWILKEGLSQEGGILDRVSSSWRYIFNEKEIRYIENGFSAGRVSGTRCWALIVLVAFLDNNGSASC